MKINRSLFLLPLFALVSPVCHGATVFADDFSEADGTAIIGKSPDIGSAWTGSAPNISGSSFDTTGAGREAYGSFTSALGVGQVLTLSYTTLPIGGNMFSSGYAGVSLYMGGSEQAFTGDLGHDTFWGVDQAAVGGSHASTDATVSTTAVFNYEYDTGNWSFTTGSGVNLSGTGAAAVAFDRLRIANGNGGDIRVDDLMVSITTIPEVSSLSLSALGCCLLSRRRRG